MCISSTCPYNITGIGADFLCRCAYIRFYYREKITLNLHALMVVPNSCNPAHAWDIIAEYFTHE